MARIISVPDVHGSHEWEVVKKIPKDNYDYIVFHGDYFDSREMGNEWPDQGENFKAICEFVREDTEHRKLLIGNHDWSYLSQTSSGSNCSGHQIESTAEVIRKLLIDARDILELAFECDGWVFSHAGFSKTAVQYMQEILCKLGICIEENEYTIDLLNATFQKRLQEYYISTPIQWTYFDAKLDWDGFFSGIGDEPTQFCLWIRPNSLLDNAYYKKQVVGHTPVCLYDKVYLQKRQNKVIFVDSSMHTVFDIFDTQEEYVFLTLSEQNTKHEKVLKVINDIKSQIIMHIDTEDFIRNSLKKHFSEDDTEKLIKLAFKDYLE